jgi:hypothetical protein
MPTMFDVPDVQILDTGQLPINLKYVAKHVRPSGPVSTIHLNIRIVERAAALV